MTMLRRAVRVFGWVSLVLIVSATVLAIYVARNWDRTWDIPAPDLHASSDPAIIARGEYLVTGPAHCTECHVSSFAKFQHFYEEGKKHVTLTGGYAFPLGPIGTLYSKNLTPDPETSPIGQWSEDDVRSMWREAARYEPQMSGDERETLLSEWQMAMDVTKSNQLGRQDVSG